MSNAIFKFSNEENELIARIQQYTQSCFTNIQVIFNAIFLCNDCMNVVIIRIKPIQTLHLTNQSYLPTHSEMNITTSSTALP